MLVRHAAMPPCLSRLPVAPSCRVEPYWIKAALLRSAAPGRISRRACGPGGPTRRGAAGQGAAVASRRIARRFAPSNKPGRRLRPMLAAAWITAIGTVALAVFAAITAVLARRAFLKQSKEVHDQGVMLELTREQFGLASQQFAEQQRVLRTADQRPAHLVGRTGAASANCRTGAGRHDRFQDADHRLP